MSLDDDRLRHLRAVVGEGNSTLPTSVGDRYELHETLGRGGMAMVVRATDTRLDRDVAVKILSIDDPSGEVARRMEAEARILARLEHPGILPVHDVGRLDDGRVWLAMKCVDGVRLDEHLAVIDELRERLRLFLRVCEPVAFAHAAGAIHRDLKPSNVMVGRFGEVLVLDWGVARLGAESAADAPTQIGRGDDATQAGAVLGTPGWMAPEQERGDTIDARVDVYALGRLLQRSFLREGEPVPRPLASVIARATAARPDDRHPDVETLAADVGEWLDRGSARSHRESVLERAGRLLRRYRAALLLVGGYVMVRLLIYAVSRE